MNTVDSGCRAKRGELIVKTGIDVRGLTRSMIAQQPLQALDRRGDEAVGRAAHHLQGFCSVDIEGFESSALASACDYGASARKRSRVVA